MLAGLLGREVDLARLALVYALIYGAAESLLVPVRVLSTTWQVPARWISGAGALRRAFIWGCVLGPGVLTRNPYAGMWMMPILLTVASGPGRGAIAGAATGAAHGVSRAAVTLQLIRKRSGGTRNPTEIVLRQLRWRAADGLMLGLLAGVLVAYI
jgi:hypothetical protein